MAHLGRPREFDRDEALEAAMLLFWRQGFSQTSMNDLCTAMGIRSPSLYAAFGSKEALYVESLELYLRTFGIAVWGRLGEGHSVRSGLEDMLLTASRRLPQSKTKPGGCMATLAGMADEWPAGIAKFVRRMRAESLLGLRSHLSIAMETGEISPLADVDRLSRFYLSVFQGMAVQARDGAKADELGTIVQTAMSVWPNS